MSDLSTAITEMGRALHALRLEVPKEVADDVTARWRALLDALPSVPDEVGTTA
jgi:hypothetical protein